MASFWAKGFGWCWIYEESSWSNWANDFWVAVTLLDPTCLMIFGNRGTFWTLVIHRFWSGISCSKIFFLDLEIIFFIPTRWPTSNSCWCYIRKSWSGWKGGFRSEQGPCCLKTLTILRNSDVSAGNTLCSNVCSTSLIRRELPNVCFHVFSEIFFSPASFLKPFQFPQLWFILGHYLYLI